MAVRKGLFSHLQINLFKNLCAYNQNVYSNKIQIGPLTLETVKPGDRRCNRSIVKTTDMWILDCFELYCGELVLQQTVACSHFRTPQLKICKTDWQLGCKHGEDFPKLSHYVICFFVLNNSRSFTSSLRWIHM